MVAHMSSVQGYRRAAIVLNNDAISFILQGHFVEARETLQDAIKLMKTSHESCDSLSGNGGEKSPDEAIGLALSRSRQRLGSLSDKTQVVRSEATLIPFAVSSEHNHSMVIEFLQNDQKMSKLQTPLGSTSMFPVTIDPIDFETCPDALHDSFSVFESSVILYNFALTLALCATAMAAAATGTGNPVGCEVASVSTKIRTQAHRIFLSVHAVLTKTARANNNDDDDDMHGGYSAMMFSTGFLILHALVLQCLGVLSSRALVLVEEPHEHDTAAAEDHRHCFLESVAFLVEVATVLPIEDHFVARAA